jgi:hypothetical protein
VLQGAPFASSLEGGGSWGGGNRAGLVEQLEALLRKREGELASYTSRLVRRGDALVCSGCPFEIEWVHQMLIDAR